MLIKWPLQSIDMLCFLQLSPNDKREINNRFRRKIFGTKLEKEDENDTCIVLPPKLYYIHDRFYDKRVKKGMDNDGMMMVPTAMNPEREFLAFVSVLLLLGSAVVHRGR